MGPATSTFLFALVVLFSSVVPAAAYHEDALPVLDSGASTKAHWVSWVFTTDGAKVAADFEVTQVRKPVQVGYAIFDQHNNAIFRFTYNAVDGTTGVYADGSPAGQNIHADLTQPSPEVPLVRLGVTFNGGDAQPVAGTYKLLMWSAGAGARHVHTLRGGPGASCGGVATGGDTFIHTARDFRGTATVTAGAGGGAGARANIDSSRGVHAEGTLVGAFFSLISGVDDMSVDTPSGSQDCPCFFGSFVSPGTPFGPGSYVFHDNGVGAAGSEGEIVLAGADAHLVGFDVPGGSCS